MDNYESIKLNKEFRYLYARGKSFVSPRVVVYLRKNSYNNHRLGITTAKKIGKAVQRNRARRIIRVAYRSLLKEISGYYDMVIVARTRCVHATSSQVTADLRKLFLQAGIINHENHH